MKITEVFSSWIAYNSEHLPLETIAILYPEPEELNKLTIQAVLRDILHEIQYEIDTEIIRDFEQLAGYRPTPTEIIRGHQ